MANTDEQENFSIFNDMYQFIDIVSNQGRIIQIILVIIFLSVSPVGYNIVVLNVPGQIIQDEINASIYNMFELQLSDKELGVLWSMTISAQAFGALIGCFTLTYFTQKYGVKYTMFNISNIILIISSVLMFLSKYTFTFFLLFAGRIFVGLYTGMACGLTPMFIKEVAPQNIKGSLGCFVHIAVCIGSAISAVLSLDFILGGKYLWGILLLMPVCTAITQIYLGRKIPDTPNFLLRNCDFNAALFSIKYFYNIKGKDVEETIKTYRDLVTNVPSQISIKEAFYDDNTRKGIILGMILNAAQIFCGSMASVSYSTFMFNSVFFSKLLTPFLPAIGSIIIVLLTIPAIRLVEIYGRRQLIIVTLIICGSSNYLMTIFSLISETSVTTSWSSYAYALTFLMMGVGYNVGIGPLAYFVPEELVHPQASTVALSFSICVNWISTMFTNFVFYPLNLELGGFSYLLFAVPTTIFTYILYLYLPETKCSRNNVDEQNLTCNVLQNIYDEELSYVMKKVSDLGYQDNSNCIRRLKNGNSFTDGVMKYTEIIRLTPLLVFICGIVPPLLGSTISISFALLFHNDAISNYNWQCGRAMLPSLSRIINLPIERVFWQILIPLHVPLRFLEIFVQTDRYTKFENVIKGKSKLHFLLIKTYTISGLLELVFLSFLSVIGERENAQLHVVFFYFFGTCGIIFMFSNTILHRRTLYHCKPYGISSYVAKIIFLTLYCILAPVMVISFYLYFSKCTPFAYEMFAICEYLEVLINILYHSTAYWDIKDKIILSTLFFENYIDESTKIQSFKKEISLKINDGLGKFNYT
uniref:MFS domain-containing protein n=1 Tax=Parastrongyloides trichosuri TaxID=131310 RepID=A0A0N4Z7W5_PARTI